MKTIKLVEEFHNAFGVNNLPSPKVPELDDNVNSWLQDFATRMEELAEQIHKAAKICGGAVPLLRLQLIQEELAELARGMQRGSIEECFDALVDLRYVCDGTVLALGLQNVFEAGFNEVHRSNMSKLEDGRPVKNEAGRVVKGKDYSPPDLGGLL